ncbi:hypothetical protein BC827DRAFT_1217005 [Russula dissimulans]|nr:hypothetical protein BC827DRAFT_1217005 [Russula dissimulans]
MPFPPPPPPDPPFGDTHALLLLTAPLFIGNLVNWLLLGVLTMQIYLYYLCFPKDRWLIKFTVYGLYVLDLTQTMIVTDSAWGALCSGWGNPTSLVHTTWGFPMVPIVSGLISSWVQIFFAYRVRIMGHSLFWNGVTMVIVAIALTQGLAAVAAGIRFAYINDTQEIFLVNPLVSLWLSGSVAADFLISVSMVYFLSVWKIEEKRVKRLIRFTVETGMLSAVAASLDLGLYLGFNQNNLHLAVGFSLSKLYSNALMASFNSRADVYERSLPTSTPDNDGCSPSGRCNTAQFTTLGIDMTTHLESVREINERDGKSVV